MKECYKCGEKKELSEFSQNKNKKDNLNSECKNCQTKYFKEYYKNNKEKHIKSVSKTQNYKKIKLAKIKKEKGCCKCGYKDHSSALHFHHKDQKQKEFTIASNYHHDLDLLLIEIEKCDVICANCHAIEHAKCNWSNEKEIPIKKTKKRKKEVKYNKPYRSCRIPIPNDDKKEQIVKKINWPEKEELEKIIWERPSEEIAKELNVSGSMLSKKCKQLGIQKPSRGYWMKNPKS